MGPTESPLPGAIERGVKRVSEANRGALESYVKRRVGTGYAPNSVRSDLVAVASLDRAAAVPLDRLRPDDILGWVALLRAQGRNEESIRSLKFRVLKFIRAVHGEPAPAVLEMFRHRVKPRNLPADILLTREEMEAALEAAPGPMDRALLLVLYEGGLRLGELVSLNVGSVVPDDVGAELVIPEHSSNLGRKTGGRAIWIYESVPDLLAWLDEHPRREAAEAPLWPVAGGGRLSVTRARERIQSAFRIAGNHRRIWPHLFRHSRFSELSPYLGSDLKLFAGWAPESRMDLRYVHRTPLNLKRRLMELYGVAAPQMEVAPWARGFAPARHRQLRLFERAVKVGGMEVSYPSPRREVIRGRR